jgi:hypothetical protein
LPLPALGVQRRLEARIGQLLGRTSPGKRTDLEPSHHGDEVDLHNRDRTEFRMLATALSGDIDLSDDEWRQSQARSRRLNPFIPTSLPDPAVARTLPSV